MISQLLLTIFFFQLILSAPIPAIITRVHTAAAVTVTQQYTTGTTTVTVPPVEIFISNGVTYTFTLTDQAAATAPTTTTVIFNDQASVAPAPTTTAAPAAPAPTTLVAITSAAPAPAPTTTSTTPAAPAPTTTSTTPAAPAPATTSTNPAAPAPATTTSTTPAAPAPATTTSTTPAAAVPTTTSTTSTAPALAPTTTTANSPAAGPTGATTTTTAAVVEVFISNGVTYTSTLNATPTTTSTTQQAVQQETTTTANAQTTTQAEDTTSTTSTSTKATTTAEGTTAAKALETASNGYTSNNDGIASNIIPQFIVYSPYTNSGACKTSDEVLIDLNLIVSRGISALRIYGTDCGSIETVLPLCEQLGLKVNQGFWISDDGVDSIDSSVSDLINWVNNESTQKWDLFSFITIGNEAIISNFCTPSELIGKISSVKSQLQAAGYTGRVTTSEPPVSFETYPELCTDSAIDFVGINPHSYFNAGSSADQAGSFVMGQKAIVEGICGSLEVFITETGYPSQGIVNGLNVPSDENQKIAIATLLEQTNGALTILTTYNDFWKAPGPYGIEQYFGVIDLLD